VSCSIVTVFYFWKAELKLGSFEDGDFSYLYTCKRKNRASTCEGVIFFAGAWAVFG